ncbi:DUF1738 domain-containing protein [Hymenobacter sp. BT186]|uniref:DUF1738 domain-containing protein n=1 Tax=Hymenobacter telluris TaxID=2816474 RepID=A0A939JCR6_9BACT|nr:zincin-like metallopeptidase domain-containing protein [Hymenobacter telluris]MBO0358645.1 DUF1738 domain-containing protein [Hymenobacter telluris]MBW3374671.1 DUF1738 domain-containing protein [Hymenobacter norwichensis]
MPQNKAQEEFCQSIADILVQQILTDGRPFMSGFKGRPGLPKNAVTGKRYNGANIFGLWGSQIEHGWESNEFASYKQLASVGKQVKRGEKGTKIAYFDRLAVEDAKTGDEKLIPFLKVSTVFNLEQTEGYEPVIVPHVPLGERMAQVEQYIANTGAVITQDGNGQAYYKPSTDSIHLPDDGCWLSTDTMSPIEQKYAVTFHELGHWTGHPTRCDRNLKTRFAERAYATEELIAETYSAVACAKFGVTREVDPNHGRYMASWCGPAGLIEVLKHDPKAIMPIASAASAALTYTDMLNEKAEMLEMMRNAVNGQLTLRL